MTVETSWWVRHVLHPRWLHANYQAQTRSASSIFSGTNVLYLRTAYLANHFHQLQEPASDTPI